ncbi:MAG TPA: hypothetical protein VMM17_01065, partial [Gemmatimonadaceae bacterium]|nr:hypothetical protein [Gemmatimonadaceae bacterium]
MQSLADAGVAARRPKAAAGSRPALLIDVQQWLPAAAAAIAFALLFASPARTLARDLWTNPDAGHGLLLIPLAGWLA